MIILRLHGHVVRTDHFAGREFCGSKVHVSL